MQPPHISIVCPVYNEKEMIPLFLRALVPVLDQLPYSHEIVFIDDGSTDDTVPELLAARYTYDHIRIISLSRNFGKESALTAGLDHAKGEVIVPMDVDLQDPPELIPELIHQWEKGHDVVLAKRVDRSSDQYFKRVTAGWFYRIHNAISQTTLPENTGDFRLITRKVVMAIQQLPENQRFMKGVFAWVGFTPAVVHYHRQARKAGRSRFNGWRLWNFALDGITSFSTAPLRIWLYIGVIVALLSFFYGSFIIVLTLFWGVKTPGFASLFTAVLFIGGIQLIGIGVLGEYIGRIYMEAKHRPPYIVDKEH
jgi:polyisoprenyl-phosphate glycosyltransferase